MYPEASLEVLNHNKNKSRIKMKTNLMCVLLIIFFTTAIGQVKKQVSDSPRSRNQIKQD